MTNPITHLHNIDQLVDQYRYFLVDQFGVLHDGYHAFAGAADALRTIKKAGGRVIIVSNSGKRSVPNVQRMNSLGFDNSCFDRLVSSGEVAWHLLNEQMIGNRIPAGARTYFLANDNNRSAIEGLPLTEVDHLNNADVLLLTGQLLQPAELQSLCLRLGPAVENRIPCICTNPDKIAYGKSGKLISSGTVAQWYAEQGGEVIWLGKPYPEIYHFIVERENISDKNTVVCIGDSVEHDIAGGTTQGFDTALVRTGIGDHLNTEGLQALYHQHQCEPTYILDALAI